MKEVLKNEMLTIDSVVDDYENSMLMLDSMIKDILSEIDGQDELSEKIRTAYYSWVNKADEAFNKAVEAEELLFKLFEVLIEINENEES